MLLAICFSAGAACADASQTPTCNGAPVDIDVWNRSQFEVLRFELDGEDMLNEPLAVEQRTTVAGFAERQKVSFTRLHEETGREIRVAAPGTLCLEAGQTLVLFDDSFRLPAGS